MIFDVPDETKFGAGLGGLIPFVERLTSRFPEHRLSVVMMNSNDIDPAFYTGQRVMRS